MLLLMASHKYNKISAEFCQRIITAAQDGDDWQSLAEALGVNYKTAYTWISQKKDKSLPKGGKNKKLSEEQIDALCDKVEKDPALTLVQLADFSQQHFGIALSASTVHNYLEGCLITLKKAHAMPATMNSDANEELHQQFVIAIGKYMHLGKQVIWMGETNVNLFCQHSQGRSPKGKRTVAVRPASKGKNIHIIGAISTVQVVHMMHIHGAFNANAAKAWVQDMLSNLPAGLTMDNMVLVCDNAPCHSKLEELMEENNGFIVCKLGPYSPQLDPLENIWSKMKAAVKSNMRVPGVNPPAVGEQRLQYVERLINTAMGVITGILVKHASTHKVFSRLLWT